MQQLMMRRPTLENLPPLPQMPPGYALRTFEESDLEPLSVLLRDAFEDPQWTPEHVRETLVDAPTVRKIFLMEADHNLVATASARIDPEKYGDAGYVHWVAVARAHQGQKLGYLVTLAVLHEFARMGCDAAILETDDHRLPAIKTYQNLGFVPEHRHETHLERWAEIANLLAAVNL